jgi:hypothetical protein
MRGGLQMFTSARPLARAVHEDAKHEMTREERR